ncbi:MAG: SDR family oxidoreductase [Nitrospiraceae bacterium]
MSVEGKVVLIAGGSGALGQSVVPAFLAAGARVVTGDRSPSTKHADGRLALSVNVTDEADVRRLVDEVIRKVGRIDVLVNLVGGFAPGRADDTEVALWQRMLTTNLTAAFLLSKAVIPQMVERGTGRILHMAARAAAEPFPGAAAYIVSKAGLAALIRTLALEQAGSGVTVNGILPSTIDTPANRTAMPEADPAQWVKPESIARLLVFLSSEEAGQINGALIPVG